MARPGDEITLDCTALDEGGAGVGVVEGRRLHVAGALPGERVTAVVEHLSPHQGRPAWGRLAQVLIPSAERVAPVCPGFGSCGGCLLQHLSYPAQVRWKTDRVREAVAAWPALAGVRVADGFPSPSPLGYRNQGKYVCGLDASGALVLGAYAPRSHAVIDLAGCRVVEPPVDEVAATLRGWLRTAAVVPFDERTGQGDLRYVIVRASAAQEVLVCLVAGRRGWEGAAEIAARLRAAEPRVVGVVLNINEARGNALYGDEEGVLAGAGTLRDRIGDVEVELGARSFFQVNRGVAARAYADLRAAVERLAAPGRVVDAYAGAGGIALTLAPLAREVVAIEESAAATRSAISRPGLRWVTGDAAEHLAAVGSADVVVLNPPRAGCAPAVLDATAALRPRLVAYLSCNPATLTRDLDRLRQRGLVTAELHPYDMLPHTPHVEVLALVSSATAC